MSTVYHIIDTPLPLTEDFASLKKEGLAYVQEYMANEWTNLNPSDPGVTILDQLCYALTELGYCTHFSMADILTDADGEIEIDDQFYLPENILTTAPVTIDDYRKYLLDNSEDLDNVEMAAYTDTETGINGIYSTNLYISTTDDKGSGDTEKAAFYQLNKSRNLGELFMMPVVLAQDVYQLSGTVEIENRKNVQAVLAAINSALQAFIFPAVIPVSYTSVEKKGTDLSEILNGPILDNGWIDTAALGTRRTTLSAMDLVQLLRPLPGVAAVSNMGFIKNGNASAAIVSATGNILVTDVYGSVSGNKATLNITCNGKPVMAEEIMQPHGTTITTHLPVTILPDASESTQQSLPKGKFRDINSYYSIQNTFPEIFRIGADTMDANASDFQIAQSRQLKGYLTLFDQVLANQFSQLANISRLFSFRNAMTGTPSDVESYYAVQDASQKANPEYPVPYTVFAPTYFYQSLYDVPHIRPLLRNNNALAFSVEIQPEALLEYNSWKDYQHDPYNSYIRGLMELMEKESINLERRNDILDHLLARHGESPMVIDTIIEGSMYTGNSAKDKVIFKSLYLQNLGLLSYNRYKAWNFLGAKKIQCALPEITVGFEEEIYNGVTVDFIFNSGMIDSVERLTETDFVNYAAIELKLNLLFGLRNTYRNFIAPEVADHPESETAKMALWLITARRGMIAVETSLLRYYAKEVEENISVNRIEFFFPDFIPSINTDEHKQRIEFFLQNELPANLSFACHYVNSEVMKKLIPAFTNWHNCLIYYSDQHIFHPWLTRSTGDLAVLINQITDTVNG